MARAILSEKKYEIKLVTPAMMKPRIIPFCRRNNHLPNGDQGKQRQQKKRFQVIHKSVDAKARTTIPKPPHVQNCTISPCENKGILFVKSSKAAH